MERFLYKNSSYMEGKRVQIDSEFQREKCAKIIFVGNDGDRISQLTDEILVDILSLLTLKESARTSVLSSRWINLWKHTPSLVFDAQSALDRIAKRHKLLESERHKYVKWVNSIVRSHKSTTLKEFKIRFDLDRSSKNSITQWLQFAFDRQVQSLELDLDNYGDSSKYYRFPQEFLTLSSCIAPKLKPPFDIFRIHHPPVLGDFKSLKELSFRCIDFSDGMIEFFLHNCPLLECLVVHESDKTSNLEVCGPSLRLKHLEIVSCFGLKSLKVSAPNLASLTVTSLKGLLLENIPMLVDVSFSCHDCFISVKRWFSQLSCCISQLEILCLDVTSLRRSDSKISEPFEFHLRKLKKLVIEYDPTSDESLVWLAALIRVSPYLEEFVLKYEWYELPKLDREMNDLMRFPHRNIKVFKFCGYYGRYSDARLVKLVLENCPALEKIIIDSSISPEIDGVDVAQNRRKDPKEQLEPYVPNHIELVIL
ncbi:hypothetical protein ABFS82_10G015700 [Erythranthe guttata]|uniref:F-box/LRR-repeat protein At3g26922-like isoform X1 n=1 Tax=Erythranthe guttata TaxID=4155 RepID=UPI00064D7810|nr:PREDICTED: F-box/LRR-repeat protein At3g26922-like isoform X1 [Erythranthe guttata]XP_012832179.1 PREDICTED: F-box/LRR-repeat protein At3g26922-like isoform X2 [Erythranthe guttata]|eukprot:XP_012832178.1 PREDICTED: F-box/LRR-repeat protein At3g26922-like isoform X1 [Erythranthe guttata]